MIAFICCSATSGFVLNVSIGKKLASVRGSGARARGTSCVYACRVRHGVLTGLGAVATSWVLGMPAGGEPGWLEATGFVGVDDFGAKIGLGDSTAPEQRPQTSPMLGGRLTYLPVIQGSLALGVEAELAFTPSWTGYGFDGPRMSYFAPVIGYRAAL